MFIRVVTRVQSTNSHEWSIDNDYSTEFFQPARVIDYSTMIESHWLFIRVVNRVQSTSSHDWLFVWLMFQQWFNNDCLINQTAWLTFLQRLVVTLIIHSSSQSSSINQLAWLIIRVIDYSTMIRQRLFNQPARVIDYLTMIESYSLFWVNQPTHQIDYSFELSIEFNQPTRMIDYSCDWLLSNDSTMIV